MSELARWGLVGYGNIGGEFARQVAADDAHQLGLRESPDFIQRSTGLVAADGVTPLGARSLLELDTLPNVVILAPPSTDSGEPAHSYITHSLEQGARIVTAEKGSVANDPSLLWNDRVGSSAACGGGSGIVEGSRQFARRADLNEMHLVLNGTLAAIMTWLTGVMAWACRGKKQ